MEKYPLGTRLLFWANRRSGVGVYELYECRPFRWLITLLDSLAGKAPGGHARSQHSPASLWQAGAGGPDGPEGSRSQDRPDGGHRPVPDTHRAFVRAVSWGGSQYWFWSAQAA